MAKETQLYEVGYLVLPTVAPEKVSDEVLALRAAIEVGGGMIVEEEQPKLRPLAYTIMKEIAHKKAKFDQAYFGWIRFHATPGTIPSTTEAIEKRENILRFLVMKTVKEVRRAARRPVTVRPATGKEEGKEKAVINEQELDREIESMIGNQVVGETVAV